MFNTLNQNNPNSSENQSTNASISSLINLNGGTLQTQNANQLSFADLAASQIPNTQNQVNTTTAQNTISPNFIPPTGQIEAGQSAPREYVIIGPDGESQVVTAVQNSQTGKVVIPISSGSTPQTPSVQNLSLNNTNLATNNKTKNSKPASQLSTEELLTILKARMQQENKNQTQQAALQRIDNQLLGVDDGYLTTDILDLESKNEKAAKVLQNLRREQLSDKMILLKQQLQLKEILEKQLRSRQLNKIQLKALISQYQQKINQMASEYQKKVTGLQNLSNQLFANRQNLPQSLSNFTNLFV